MFDDPKQVNPPANLPTEPVDMLAEVEHDENEMPAVPKALDAGLLKKKVSPEVSATAAPVRFQTPSSLQAMTRNV